MIRKMMLKEGLDPKKFPAIYRGAKRQYKRGVVINE